MSEIKLGVIRRNGKIAPFIGGWNVWELDPSEWTPNVQAAILHAYELGAKHQRESCINNVPVIGFSLNDKFPEPK
jgi:hypothetical protein